MWFSPPEPHILLTRAIPAKNNIIQLQGSLDRAALAYLWDHKVGGQALFPGVGMLEMAAAAMNTMLQTGGNQSLARAALADVAIPAPLLLPLTAQISIIAAVNVRTGRISIQSGSGKAAPQTHLFGAALGVNSGAGERPMGAVQSLQRLLPGVFLPVGTPLGAPLASALGSVVQDPRRQAAQYYVNPALMDNCTQVRLVSAHMFGTGCPVVFMCFPASNPTAAMQSNEWLLGKA